MKKLYYLLLGVLLISVGTQAQTYKMHTLYMYSFSKYIQWPEDATDGDFKIGIVGNSLIAQPLEKMATLKKVNGRLIKVITFASVEEIQDCNILFLPVNQSENFSKVLDRVGDRPILLVTEKEGLGVQGSSINFILKNNKLMFEINDNAIDKANLKVASALKKYAVHL